MLFLQKCFKLHDHIGTYFESDKQKLKTLQKSGSGSSLPIVLRYYGLSKTFCF